MSHTSLCDRDEHLGPLDEPESSPAASPGHPERSHVGTRAWSFLRLGEVRWAALSLFLFALAAVARVAGAPGLLVVVLFAGCYGAGGWEPGLVGLRALRAKALDVDLLMVVAALVAAAIGQVLDGGLLIVIFATSGALEAVATKRTQDSVHSLLALAPDRASRLLLDGSEERVDAGTLEVGHVVLIRPGERVAADGVVLEGASEVDQASITGEPLPVPKRAGAAVFAGTVNGTGVLRVRVDRAAADTVVARIVAMVTEASATKARMQLYIERVEQRYSVAMVAATLTLFAVPILAGGALRPTLLRAMTFMIVASPCAVVLATMPPLLSAIANAGRHGVLVKSAVIMELLGRTGLVAFDKTGTLTEGTPRLTELWVSPGADMSADEILRLAAGAEAASEHPVGRAVVMAAYERGTSLPAASGFDSLPGQGVHAVVAGRRVAVGNPLSAGEAPLMEVAEAALVARLQARGRTVAVVTVDGVPVGVLGFADRPRSAAAATVRALRALTGRLPVVLTGDSRAAAEPLAEEIGIADVRAGLLPADKVTAVHELQADGTRVAVVGDGVNDAPALAAAHLGVAMGGRGADLTLETADVVVIRDELANLPAVIAIARSAKRIVTQNLCFAAVAIAVLVTVDLAGHLPLPLGVAGHEGSTVLVGLNGLRLLAPRAWEASPEDPAA